ncbi:uncharacterized protein METZ01_LOCUS406060, partial [marine metagenome]
YTYTNAVSYTNSTHNNAYNITTTTTTLAVTYTNSTYTNAYNMATTTTRTRSTTRW